MMTFVNLPVKDLAAATAFFAKLGFSFDEQFTDENATRMIISDDAMGERDDQGFMYMRGFRDLDGHQWSFIHMDMSAIPEQ
jgi:predicted lactoylglutathione lyase